MKRLVLSMVILLFVGITMQAQNRTFVDLGLSSGTKWCTKNETGYYSYSNAIDYSDRFEDSYLPSIEQFSELIAECDWTWTGTGYRIKGPNGNSIYLPAEGNKASGFNSNCHENGIDERGWIGYYWSSEPSQITYCDYANWGYNGWFYTSTFLYFSNNSYGCTTNITYGSTDCGFFHYQYSVRLVQ